MGETLSPAINFLVLEFECGLRYHQPALLHRCGRPVDIKGVLLSFLLYFLTLGTDFKSPMHSSSVSGDISPLSGLPPSKMTTSTHSEDYNGASTPRSLDSHTQPDPVNPDHHRSMWPRETSHTSTAAPVDEESNFLLANSERTTPREHLSTSAMKGSRNSNRPLPSGSHETFIDTSTSGQRTDTAATHTSYRTAATHTGNAATHTETAATHTKTTATRISSRGVEPSPRTNDTLQFDSESEVRRTSNVVAKARDRRSESRTLSHAKDSDMEALLCDIHSDSSCDRPDKVLYSMCAYVFIFC